MTSNLDVTVSVNTDSGTIDVSPFAEPTLAPSHARAPEPRRTAAPRELAA